jgi:hypothetical protein
VAIDHSVAEQNQSFWGAVTCHRFRQATCRRRINAPSGPQAAECGSALPTGRQSIESSDKSPHSRIFTA